MLFAPNISSYQIVLTHTLITETSHDRLAVFSRHGAEFPTPFAKGAKFISESPRRVALFRSAIIGAKLRLSRNCVVKLRKSSIVQR